MRKNPTIGLLSPASKLQELSYLALMSSNSIAIKLPSYLSSYSNPTSRTPPQPQARNFGSDPQKSHLISIYLKIRFPEQETRNAERWSCARPGEEGSGRELDAGGGWKVGPRGGRGGFSEVEWGRLLGFRRWSRSITAAAPSLGSARAKTRG